MELFVCSIRYTCNAEPLLTAVCHCPHCQKQSGTSFSVIVAVPKDSLVIAGQTLKTFDDVGESGLPVLRRFCGKCGSPIVSHVGAMPDLAFIKAGTLESTSWLLNPTMEVCFGDRPSFRARRAPEIEITVDFVTRML